MPVVCDDPSMDGHRTLFMTHFGWAHDFQNVACRALFATLQQHQMTCLRDGTWQNAWIFMCA